MSNRYWFARKFPLSEGGDRMSPINSMGWMVVTLFVSCLIAGAVGLALFSFTYRAPFVGVLTLVGFAILGTVVFLVAAYTKGDKQHTADDYKAGRVRNA